jgi:Fic family protein
MIEGTQSSLSDLLLFELDQEPGVPLDDVREVSNYVAALDHGLRLLEEGLPLSLRLFREIHGVLLTKGRGSKPTPVLLKAALAHVQFETIHPFLDGNGRLGRLLIALLLCEQKVLREPMLYLSLYFKTHRQYYYELLNKVRVTGDWEAWLDFFAEAVIVTATQAVETAQQLLDLSNQDRDKISGLGRAAASTLQVHRALMEHPIATSGSLVEKTGITPATVNKALGHLEQLGIVKELTAQKRNRLFSYAGYIEIMSRGTELPGR